MTLTRQRRHLARIERAVKPRRQARLEADLRTFYETGEECLVGTGGVGVGSGRITELEPGSHVVVGTTSIPWRLIKKVMPWPPPERPNRFGR